MLRLIDADALFYKLCNTDPNTKSSFCDGIAKAMEFILTAPSIDAVPVVHGRWEFHYMGANKDMVLAECHECGAVFKLTAFDFGLCYNYCPDCGAKMDLEVDGDGQG